MSALPDDLLAQLKELTAKVQASVDRDLACGQNRSRDELLSDNQREETDDGNREETVMCRVSKPYKNRSKWRVRVTDTETGGTKNHIYDTEAEAVAARPKLLREYIDAPSAWS